MKQYHLSTGISLDSRSIKASSTTTSSHSTRQFQAFELVSCGMRCSKERIWFPGAPFLPLLRPKSPSSSCPSCCWVGENFETAPKCQKLNVFHQGFHKFMSSFEWWFVTELLCMNCVQLLLIRTSEESELLPVLQGLRIRAFSDSNAWQNWNSCVICSSLGKKDNSNYRSAVSSSSCPPMSQQDSM